MRPPTLTALLLLAPCALASPVQAAPREDASRTLNTRFTYKAVVPKVASGTKALDLWLPIPSDNELQKVTNLKVDSPVPHRVTQERTHDNRMVYVRVERPTAQTEVTVSFEVARQTAGLANRRMEAGPDAKRYLAAERLVPIDGRYEEIAKEVAGDKTTAYDKVQAMYEHVVATMQYDYKKESPHLGEGDVAFVCDYKKGNCSDLHSYLISLARSMDVPVYLEYGFPLTGIPVPEQIPAKGKIGGYHCWAWYYDKDKGWLPLDASDGRRWLDAKHPEVKEKLGSQLVLERSAVAFSRGRDIVLEPRQKQASLNNFIYPYAEADGETVEATWDLSYELLSPGVASTPTNDELQRQIEELRRMVLSQQEEITRLKGGGTATGQAGGDAPVKEAPPGVTVPSREKVTVYGFVRADMIYDSGHPSPNSQTPFFVQSPSNPNVDGQNDQFTFHPRLTRIGLNFTAPEETLPGWSVGGKVEFDFQGGGSESRPNPRARHLYVELRRGGTSVLIGQTWDLLSPLLPSPNDDTLMWNVGNLGDRRPQLRFTQEPAGAPLSWALALGLSGAVDPKDLDANGVRDGEDSGMPHLQARVAWKSPSATVGVSGHVGRERTTKAVGGETNFDSHSIGADLSWRLTPRLDLRGEVWTGRNLSDFRGGVGQGVNVDTGDEIRSSGGWAEFGFNVSPRYRLALGYTLDDPVDDDVAANGRTRNSALYLHNRWQLGLNLELGFNYLYWTTSYKGMDRGIDNRFNVYLTRRF